MNAQSVIEKIKTIRRSKGISQESVAYDLKIDYSTYGKMERGQISLTVDRLFQIVKILDISILDLFEIKETVSLHKINEELKNAVKIMGEHIEQNNKIISILKGEPQIEFVDASKK